jgi:hypothetical protein
MAAAQEPVATTTDGAVAGIVSKPAASAASQTSVRVEPRRSAPPAHEVAGRCRPSFIGRRRSVRLRFDRHPTPLVFGAGALEGRVARRDNADKSMGLIETLRTAGFAHEAC